MNPFLSRPLLSASGILFLVPFTCFCCLQDLRSGIIPNALILGGLICGLTNRILSVLPPPSSGPGSGLPGPGLLAACLPGFLLPLLLLCPLVLLRMMGGGDVKLLSVIGLFLGPGPVLKVMLRSLLVGGVVSLIMVLRQGTILFRFSYLTSYMTAISRNFSRRDTRSRSLPLVPPYRGPGTRNGEFCFSPCILLGLILTLL